MKELVKSSLVSDGPKEKLIKKLGLEPDENGKYLRSFIQKVADELDLTYEEAKLVIADDISLSRMLFVLA